MGDHTQRDELRLFQDQSFFDELVVAAPDQFAAAGRVVGDEHFSFGSSQLGATEILPGDSSAVADISLLTTANVIF